MAPTTRNAIATATSSPSEGCLLRRVTGRGNGDDWGGLGTWRWAGCGAPALRIGSELALGIRGAAGAELITGRMA